MPKRRRTRGIGRLVRRGLLSGRRWRVRRVGLGYLGVWIALVAAGLYQQANLVLLIAGMAAGPVVASLLTSSWTLKKVKVTRRAPPSVFSGEPLIIDYWLQNRRRSDAALALRVEDAMAPADRSIPGARTEAPSVTFARVAPRSRMRIRWKGPSPSRGRYLFSGFDLVTSAPFGLVERRDTVDEAASIVVYPRVGKLTRRWHKLHRESTQTKRGRRHDRTAQQQEYHGLREYRAGDSPRWIHWRTTARIGKPMVKEFEHQNDQDLAILLDPWLPRIKATPEMKEIVEEAIRFAATACVESSRQSGRRILLGWTGPTPGVIQGAASAKLLHEQLEALAQIKPAVEGRVSGLLDVIPPAVLRESLLVLVSTRPVNLMEEAEGSKRLAGAASRGLTGRVVVLDASKGELADLVTYDGKAAKSERGPSR